MDMPNENDWESKKRNGSETTAWKKSSKKMKIEIRASSPVSHLVGLFLASAARINTLMAQSTAVSLQNYILNVLRNSSLDSSFIEDILLKGLLPALPIFLRCSLLQVSLQSMEILGALVLWSYEMNVKVSGDKQIVGALVAMLVKKNNDFSRYACNALMDLATTSHGREILRENGATEQLLWEGMMHIALHCWEKHQKLEDIKKIYSSEKIFYLAVQMLHIAIRILGDSCSLLRKACTVATSAWHYDRRDKELEVGLHMSCDAGPPGDQQELSSEEFFSRLIGMVRSQCKFADAYKLVEVNVRDLDYDTFPWMKWLRHLFPEGTNSSNLHGWNDHSEQLRKIFQPDQLNVLDCERAFSQVKIRFSNEVSFEETLKGFEFLLEKYRHARKQFINGMLALHSRSKKMK